MQAILIGNTPGYHEKMPEVMVISMRPNIKTTTDPDAKQCGIIQLLEHSTLMEQPFTHVMPTHDSISIRDNIINAIEQ